MPTKTIEITAEGKQVLGGVLFTELGVNTSAPEFLEVLYAHHSETIITGGVRSGKSTVGSARNFLDIYIRVKILRQPGLYWVVGPNYPQTVEEIRYMAQ